MPGTTPNSFVLLFICLCAAQSAFAGAVGDFDGDGKSDVALGVTEGVDGQMKAGAVQVFYSGDSGLTTYLNQFLSQATPGISGVPEESDYFGVVLAAGDFDGNGSDDLVIGVPFEDLAGCENGGSIHVVYSDLFGLDPDTEQSWHQDVAGIPGVVEAGDEFGSAFAVGDFNDDGFDDLAIGAPREAIGTVKQAGCVHILYGSSTGLTTTKTQAFDRSTTGIVGDPTEFDCFGYRLCTGDFDGNGRDDLAIGVAETFLSLTSVGGVHILFGGKSNLELKSGLSTNSAQFFNPQTPGVPGDPQTNLFFSSALTAGDFNSDGMDELVIGSKRTIGSAAHAGEITLLRGTITGLTTTNVQTWSAASTGIPDDPEFHDRFGQTLSAGDFNGDNRDDLAIGINESMKVGKQDIISAGNVLVLYADTKGLVSTGCVLLSKLSTGIDGEPVPLGYFGTNLDFGDFNADGLDDLLIGAPGATVNGRTWAGDAHVLYGQPNAPLTGTGSVYLHQDQAEALDECEQDDMFGVG